MADDTTLVAPPPAPATDPVAPDPVALADAACLQPLRLAAERLYADFDEGLIALLRHGIERHREVVESIDLAGDAPTDWGERADRLLQYRRAVSTELLEPLHHAIARSGPARALYDRAAAALAESTEASRALPVTLVCPWPEGALERRPHDSFRRRTGKLFARVLSPARKAGRDREAPLRATTLRHLRRRVAPTLDAATMDGMVRCAQWSAELERAVTEWGVRALPALIRSELPADDGGADHWRAVHEAALALESVLQGLATHAPQDSLRAPERLADSLVELQSELAVAGSFLLSPSDEEAWQPTLEMSAKAAPVFAAWGEAVAAGLSLHVTLLACLSAATAVQKRLVWRFREQCAASVESYPSIADTLDELVGRLAGRGDLRDRLAEVKALAEAALEPAIAAVPPADTISSRVAAVSESAVETLLAMVRQAPPLLVVHDEDARPRRRMRRFETRELPVQELARQSFDALRIERIRSSATGLVEAVDQQREDVSALRDVFEFAYDAAGKELDEAEKGAEARAVELVTEALRSMAESLRQEVHDLDAGIVVAHRRVADEITEGSLGLLDRVSAGGMQARLLAVRSWAADVWAAIHERWGPPVARARALAIRGWSELRRLATRSLARGSEIVGSATAERAASVRTLRSLAEPGAVTETLPLVYQRLFTLFPLSEGGLLVGRSAEVDDALARWARWRSEDGVPLVVEGRQGSGITSFLSVLCERLEEAGGTVARASLDERVGDEAELAELLAPILGVSGGTSLRELGAAVFAAPRGAVPDAVVVDNLEHLYMRVPGGTDLIERLLTLMAETEPRIFWIGGITTSAWQLVSATEPAAISQVDVLHLEPLGHGSIREAITARHRRSGLPIRYPEPTGVRLMLRRRLRRMSDPGAHRRMLEDDFFEQVERAASGHLRLALFQWLQAADFGTGEGVLMHAPERPDFSLLDSLDLTQNFTLKAFLEHRTLTLAEHDRIFRLPRQVSYQIFESLANRHLIRAVGRDPAAIPDRSEAEGDLRYEIQPLLMGAVLAHLGSRNIVH